MTTQTMRSQVERIKVTLDSIKPKPEPTVKIITEPGSNADAEIRPAYSHDLAESQRTHDRVFVVTGRMQERSDCDQTVQYVQHDWQATTAILAGQRSESGNVNRLADFLKSLHGNVLGVVANPPPDVHSRRLQSQS